MNTLKKGDIVKLVTRSFADWDVVEKEAVKITACGKVLTRFESVKTGIKGELLTSKAVTGDKSTAREYLEY